MKRRGFALLTVLWMIAVVGSVVAGSLQLASEGAATSLNRVTLARAGWAREACLEILLSRFAGDVTTRVVDSVDLGRGTWCRAQLEDTGARLDLNHAAPDALRLLLGNDSLVDALLDWRDPDDLPRPHGAEAEWYGAHRKPLPRNGPFVAVAELARVRGFDGVEIRRWESLLTTDGSGRVNLNSAPPEVLQTLPGFGPEAVSVATRLRLAGEAIAGTDRFLALLSPEARSVLMGSYQEFSRQVAYEPSRFEASVVGGVSGRKPLSRTSITLVAVGSRLAVIRRRSE
jgi:general secretion pathway protein K